MPKSAISIKLLELMKKSNFTTGVTFPSQTKASVSDYRWAFSFHSLTHAKGTKTSHIETLNELNQEKKAQRPTLLLLHPLHNFIY